MRTLMLVAAVLFPIGSASAQMCSTYGNVTTCSGFPTQQAPVQQRNGFLDGMNTGANVLESIARTDLLNQQSEALERAQRREMEALALANERNRAFIEMYKRACFKDGRYIGGKGCD